MNIEDREIQGRIFDIQKFSTHDGPGVRTIVFLKGCVLRCRWCCNPESQSFQIETMLQNGVRKVIGRDVTVGEVMDEVLKDMPYYRRSGGGITLSGGEALCSPDFATALLRESKRFALSTAVETACTMPYEVIERFIPLVDVFLTDVKHMNSRKHEAFTGMKNELILSNIARLSREAKRLVIRVPVIPGFNDTIEEISEIARFAASLERVEQMHLLPYHRLGYDKYIGLGREYLMGDAPLLTAEKIEQLRAAAAACGPEIVIGG